MINIKIQSVLEAIVSSFSPVVNTDVLPVTPFCVHDTKVAATLRTKEGIYGFEYDLGVMVVGDTEEQIDPVVENIIDAIEMLSDGVIEECRFETMGGLQYDPDLLKFHNQLNFKVITNNL